MRTHGLESLALRLIPRSWRDSIARDLEEEYQRTSTRALQATGIGIRLRIARLQDSLTTSTRAERPNRSFFMHDFSRDLRLALRGIVRRPGYSMAIIATLALGIGANTAIFSVFNWILLRPLPAVSHPEELVTVRYQSPKSTGRFFIAYGDYTDLRDGVSGFAGLAGSLPLTITLGIQSQDDGGRVESEMVTTNYFSVLGARPAPGRDFMAAEERLIETLPPAIVSHRLWQRTFGGDVAAVGREINLDGRPFVVVGIAPKGFQGRSLVTLTDVWVPVGAHMSLVPQYGKDTLTSRRGTLFGDSLGRLKSGVSLAQAQQEASAAANASREFMARGRGGAKSSIGPVLSAGLGHEAETVNRLKGVFNLLMGAVGLVLLLACANAANLLLARTTARRREIAVCQAIGASRLRIIRQHLAEGLVLSAAAGVAGLALAAWLTSLFDGMRLLTYLPAVKGVTLDWRVCAFAITCSLLTGLIFSTAPAVAGSRVDLQSSLKDGVTVSRRGRALLRSGLVTIQVCVSIVLLVSAGLFIRTLQNIRAVDLGMNVEGVSSFVMDPSRFGYSKERSQQLLGELVSRVSQIPGIDATAFTWATPFSMSRSEMGFARRETPKTLVEGPSSAISRGYFAVMKIPLVAGRDFTDAEFGRLNDKSGVIILSESMAKELFPGGGALGSRLLVDYPEKMEVEVVGVVGDVRGRPITAAPEPYAYEPAGQRWPTTWGNIVVRSSLPTAEIAAAIRQVTQSVDRTFTPPLVESFATTIDRVLSEQRLFARLSGVFASVAALLAAIGIYAMMSGAVSERRKEFGIRLALGANGSSVLRLVLRSALMIAAVGLIIGLGAAAALRRVIETRLYGVSGFDPVTIGIAALGMTALTILASLVPAARAARVDPVRSLRVE